MAIICQKMGWTYDQYLRQPVWFIEVLLLKMGIEAEHAEQLSKQHYGAK